MADLVTIDGDTILSRHRKEKKDLQATIQALKKTASKGDKKKRKEILEEISKLEIQLDKKQSEELNNSNDEKALVTLIQDVSLDKKEEDVEKDVVLQSAPKTPPRLTKAQKRRDKKAREEKEKAAEILAEEELNKNGPRMVETKAIIKILKDKGLCLQPILSDGDCLYNAVRHQLEITRETAFDVNHLRRETANYILNNKDSLIFYMTNNATGEVLTNDEFIKYCDDVCKTSAWGGQIEIRALSNILKVPIEVLQSNGSLVQGENEYPKPNLIITYHRHMYSLGEHYNSTKPYVPGSEDPLDGEEANDGNDLLDGI